MKRSPITLKGSERLRAELDELKSVKRPQIIEAIAEARAHGDLKENAEYHAAREQQSFTEGRINALESQLSNAQVIDVSKLDAAPRIVFGATVELCDEDTGEESVYQIVGDIEADIKENRISILSPIARALIGKEEEEVIEFDAPNGVRVFEVLSVKYL